MRAYKAFNKDMTCTLGRGTFQYEPGKTYEEKEANCVRNGFHCCENPADCMNYYAINAARIFLVEAAGDIDEDGTDTKISCTKITLIKELSLPEYVFEIVKYITGHMEKYVCKSGNVADIAEDVADAGKIAIAVGENPRARITEEDGVLALIRTKNNIPVMARMAAAGKGIKKNTWYRLGEELEEIHEEKTD